MLYVPFTDAWKTNFSISTPQKKKFLPFHFHYTLFFAIIGLWTIYENEMRTRCTIHVACQLLPLNSMCPPLAKQITKIEKFMCLLELCIPLYMHHALLNHSFIIPVMEKNEAKIHKNKLNKKKVLHKNIFILLFLMSSF